MVNPKREIPPAAAIDDIVERGLRLRAWPAQFRKLYLDQSTERLLQEGQFLLRLGLLVCMASIAIDLIVNPAMAPEGASLRGLFVAPMALAGLFAVEGKNAAATQIFIAGGVIAFACITVHLATHMSAQYAPRYIMAVAMMPALANMVMPLRPRSQVNFCIAYTLASFATLTLSSPQSVLGNLDYFMIMVLSAVMTMPVVYRIEKFNRRNFLLGLRHRLDAEELVEANRMLRELSERDPLTGLTNRRCFERIFAERFAVASEGKSGRIALMMIDLDRFKAFNDKHGHQAGDHCLRLVSAALTRAMGEADGVVSRYGGEEFIAVLREKCAGEAEKLAEEVRLEISGLLNPAEPEAKSLITTSIGLALGPIGHVLEREELIEMADAALYSAKRAGRNRVAVVEAGELTQMSA